MEPRPPKGARPAPQRPPQQPAPGWEQPAQPNRPAAPPSESGYGGPPRYPGYDQPGYGQGNYPPPQDPAYGQRYPAPGYGQPGYGQTPPPDPYGGYNQGGYPPQPAAGGGYPPYPSNEPYGGGYTPAPGYGQPAQPPTPPPGRGSSGGWIAPLPDEDLNSAGQQPGYGAGYGKGGFSVDPRAGQPLGGPNRQTQIIAALAIGGLALMILAIVIGFIIFGGDDDDNGQANAAATETAIALAAPQNDPTATSESENAAEPTGTPEEGAETNANEPAPAPTEPPAEPTATSEPEALLFDGELTDLLPTSGDLPAGFAATTDPVRLQRSEVAANLDSSNAAAVEEQLREWRFDRHWRQEYVIAEADYDVNETSVLFVSMNSFRVESGASEALELFASAAESLGMVRAEGVNLGDESVMLTSDANGHAVVIYVRRGNVLMRMYGFSEQGDPTADVIALTESVLAKFP
ncbi:MAG: hypothetical protein IT334_10165 [Thermomicrobiales bacterium]|nr:hypothetical protein [Thermomicrobiales bacterium]